jgi:ArsR family transcriptional regulator
MLIFKYISIRMFVQVETIAMLQTFKAELFKALGHPVRIRILEFLRSGELTVSELQTRLEIDSSTVSQQLALMRARQLVVGRKEGTSVYYRVVDPQVYDLLDAARAMFERHLLSLQAMAEEDPAISLVQTADQAPTG